MTAQPDAPMPITEQKVIEAFSAAALSIAGELSVDKVLQQITESARILVNARYAALGVPNLYDELDEFISAGMSKDEMAAIGECPMGKGLLGAIITERRSIRIPYISHDPRSAGFPDNHPAMERFLGVPIMSGDEVLGNLYLTEKLDGQPFSEEDQELIEVLAAHAAIAIRNARLYAQVGRLAVTEERSRIGMDLHDGVIQSIYAVGLTLESVRLSLQEATPNMDDTDRLLAVAIDGLNEAIRDIRNFILDLRPQRFSGNLRQGLERLARECQTNALLPIELDVAPNLLDSLPAIVARTIFLTTQEALANVARHAQASEVVVRLHRDGPFAVLTIHDDGVGFNVNSSNHFTGHGLANMRTRAEELNGHFRVRSLPGNGTTIIMSLPAE